MFPRFVVQKGCVLCSPSVFLQRPLWQGAEQMSSRAIKSISYFTSPESFFMMFLHLYDYIWARKYMNQTMCVCVCVCVCVGMCVCVCVEVQVKKSSEKCPWGGISLGVRLCTWVQKDVLSYKLWKATQYISKVTSSCRHTGILWGNACDIVGVQFTSWYMLMGKWRLLVICYFLLQHCRWAWK